MTEEPTRMDRKLAANIAQVAQHVYDLCLETELYDEHSPVFALLTHAQRDLDEAERLLLNPGAAPAATAPPDAPRH